MLNPENQHANGTNQPQQRIRKIHPHRVLHAQDPRVALRIRLDVHVAKQAKQRDPQDEERRVRHPRERDAREEGD